MGSTHQTLILIQNPTILALEMRSVIFPWRPAGLLEKDVTWKEQCKKRRTRKKAAEARIRGSSDESSMGDGPADKDETSHLQVGPEEVADLAVLAENVWEQEPPLPSSSSCVPHPEPDAIPVPVDGLAEGSDEQLSKTLSKFGRPATPTPKKDTLNNFLAEFTQK